MQTKEKGVVYKTLSSHPAAADDLPRRGRHYYNILLQSSRCRRRYQRNRTRGTNSPWNFVEGAPSRIIVLCIIISYIYIYCCNYASSSRLFLLIFIMIITFIAVKIFMYERPLALYSSGVRRVPHSVTTCNMRACNVYYIGPPNDFECAGGEKIRIICMNFLKR